MLAPADVVSGKLLVQVGFVDAETVRATLRVADADPDISYDLVARLAAAKALTPAQVSRIRRFVAMFEYVRHEAVYLRQIEKSGLELDKESISDLIAQVEGNGYRHRLAQLLVHQGRLSQADAERIDRATRDLVRSEDMKVLARYQQQDYAGVARPLIPRRVVDESAFRLSVLFRSRDTLRRVDTALVRMMQSDSDAGPVVPEPLDFVVPSSDAPPPLDDDSKVQLEQLATARFAKVSEPAADAEQALSAVEQIGDFTVVETLGRGGMGAVYLAQDLGTMVAIKVILAERAEPDDLARFEREIVFTGQIHHANVVNLIEEGTTEEGLRYMAIPFFAGKDLSTVLKEQGALLEPAVTFDIIERVLEGLGAIHEQGLVHRDLKPENVFVLAGSDRRIKLVDLGIARRMDDHLPDAQRAFRSRAGVISGSPAYIAPETIADEAIDARTDIYSAGVMLFQLLTGRLPLWGEAAYDYLREHLLGVPLTLAQGKKDANWCRGIEQLLASMLAKDPNDRPPSCAAILELLRGGLREETLATLKAPLEEEIPGTGLFNTFFKMWKR